MHPIVYYLLDMTVIHCLRACPAGTPGQGRVESSWHQRRIGGGRRVNSRQQPEKLHSCLGFAKRLCSVHCSCYKRLLRNRFSVRQLSASFGRPSAWWLCRCVQTSRLPVGKACWVVLNNNILSDDNYSDLYVMTAMKKVKVMS